MKQPRKPKSNIEIGQTYRFTKSGSLVRAIEMVWYGSQWLWQVARTDTGKEMLVQEHALTKPKEEA